MMSTSLVEYPVLSSECQQHRRDSYSSQTSSRHQRGAGGVDGFDNHQGSSHGSSLHNSSSNRYNGSSSNRSPPRRYQSHIGIAANNNIINNNNGASSTTTGNNNQFLNKSFRKSPNRASSNVLTSSSAHNTSKNNSTTGNTIKFDPLSGSNHSTRSSNGTGTTASFQHSYKKPLMPAKQCYLAMDCEMVGTVSGQSVAARVVLVDWKGRKVYDSYCRPSEAVSDYRTFVSGVTAEHLDQAPSATEVVAVVSEILHDKILVGHGLDNDLKALGLTHPWNMTRDTAYYQPFMRLLDNHHQHLQQQHQHQAVGPAWGPRKLKDLAKEKLQRDIQVAGVSHCPVEDAAAALDLYKSHRPRWEACMSNEEKRARQQALQAAAAAAAANLYTHDFDELVVVPMAPPTAAAAASLHSYSYHGAVPAGSAEVTSDASGMMTYHHQSQHHHHPHHHGHHNHHRSSFRQPTYGQSQRGMMDPLQSQSFHYPRSHTMAEYRDYNNPAMAMATTTNADAAAAAFHHHHHNNNGVTFHHGSDHHHRHISSSHSFHNNNNNNNNNGGQQPHFRLRHRHSYHYDGPTSASIDPAASATACQVDDDFGGENSFDNGDFQQQQSAEMLALSSSSQHHHQQQWQCVGN